MSPARRPPSPDLTALAGELGGRLVSSTVLAGGFSHQTRLLDLGDRRVVARFGGEDSAIEAAVMDAARPHVPVPEILLVKPGTMVIAYVPGTVLSTVLGTPLTRADAEALGTEVGGVVARIGTVTFERPGFFRDGTLAVTPEKPWSRQLVPVAEACGDRLSPAERSAWARLCAGHAPLLEAVDDQARLVHADINPKNILVRRTPTGWQVTAVLDWEFGYSGCPYGDVANMARFGDGYPDGFLTGFTTAFASAQPPGLPSNWALIGRVLDMFALSDLTTRPPGHVTGDQAADRIRDWLAHGVPT